LTSLAVPSRALQSGGARGGARELARFYLWHAVLPGLAALAVLGAFEASAWDVRIQNLLFDAAANRFPYHQQFLLETVIRDFGRLVVILVGVGLLGGLVLSYRREALRPWRRALLYALLSLMLEPLAIAQIKHVTVIHCPRDLARYGGDQPYVRLFEATPAGVEAGHCWPGGHSSGGFALMSLYFVFRRRRPRQARVWLAGGFVYGLVLGGGRVVQGAHFASHMLWAAAICWAISLALYELVLRRSDAAAG
jgi:membrane-associated PAP2 superfamily phosphatase